VKREDLSTHFSRPVKYAHEGEEIIFVKAGRPYRKLVPLEERKERTPGLIAGRVTEAFFEALPGEELEVWER